MTDSTPTGGAARLVTRSAAVGAGTLLSRLTGVLRVAVTASVLGSAVLADTYNKANSAPNIVYELLLGGVISATLVPLFVDIDARDDRAGLGAVIGVATSALVALTGIAMLGAPAIARVFALGVHGGQHHQAVATGTVLVWCFMPQIFFYGVTAIASAILNARRRFAVAAFAPVLNNVVVVSILLAVQHSHRHLSLADVDRSRGLTLVIGLGTTAGIVAMTLGLGPALRASGALGFRLDWRHPMVRRMIRLSGWTFGYAVSNQLALMTVLLIARGRGEWTAYQYAYTIFQLPHGLFAVSIMTALGPELAGAARARDRASFRRQFTRGLRYVLVVVAPAAAGLCALSRPTVALLLRHGSFTSSGVGPTAAAVIGFALGLVPFSVYLYALRAFYAIGDTRTPFFINCVENLLNIVFALALYPLLGVGGLALAFSAAYLGAALLAAQSLRVRLRGLDGVTIRTSGGRAGTAALCAGLAAWATARPLHSGHGSLFVLVVAGGAGCALYLCLLMALRAPEVLELRELLPGRAPRPVGRV
jgi:putative peptidoglycan lipid II flippase